MKHSNGLFQIIGMAGLVVFIILPAVSSPIPPDPSRVQIAELSSDDFLNETGRRGIKGWEFDYKRDKPGYAFIRAAKPLVLGPGLYRSTFHLRRGHYPKKGLLHTTYPIFRLEIWSVGSDEVLVSREIQIDDLEKPNRYEDRWIEFTLTSSSATLIEPRVYWMGIANGEVASVTLHRYDDPQWDNLVWKEQRLSDLVPNLFMENGLIVARDPEGNIQEVGDAATYTGFYAAALAWKYAVTKDPHDYNNLENVIQALHNLIKGEPRAPIITRFVDENFQPYPKPPSKDVFTSFFLAYNTAYPFIKNEALKNQMQSDIEKLGNRFLMDGLGLKVQDHFILSLTPYFTTDEVRSGVRKLLSDKRDYRKFMKTLKIIERSLPFTEAFPGMKNVQKALRDKDELALVNLTVPTMNGVLSVALRVRNLLREQYRSDLFPRRPTYLEYPGIKLERLLTYALKKFPQKPSGRRIDRLSDLKVLASNALISLHIIKSAQNITGGSQFIEYYNTNLFTQDALLKTALDWDGFEEDITRTTSGNTEADQQRKGYLSALSLYNLYQTEKNPTVKNHYATLILRSWKHYRHDDNPLFSALSMIANEEEIDNTGFIYRGLSLYPEDRRGHGESYWRIWDNKIGNEYGGGIVDGYSREPLPVSHRPKDSFLWQRSARRLRGDFIWDYPPTDFLFVYWLCRYHGIIPTPSSQPISNINR